MPRIIYSHGTSAEWAQEILPLAVAQPGLDTDTGDVRVGNGNDLWANLPTAYNVYGDPTNTNSAAFINDSQKSNTTTWSSQKIDSQDNATLVAANQYADQAAQGAGGPKWARVIQNSDGTWPTTTAGPSDSTLYFGTVGVGSPPPGGATDLVVLKDPS